MAKTIEEVRKAAGYNQTDWAQLIGSTFRTYLARLQGTQPKWQLSEIIKATEYTKDGKVRINILGATYDITVKKVI